MSNKYDEMDEIIDRLIKGGPGSGRRGHKSGPASDVKREMDPNKKKKILASDKRVVRKESKDLSHEELQSKIDSHRDLSESEHLSPASRESYAAKHKALLAVQKKKGPKPAEAPAPEGVASRPGPFGNINKGGPGSGRKGHMGVTPDRKQRESNRQKAGDALQTSKDAKRIIAELGLDKEDLKELRDYASAEGITPSQFIVNNKAHIKTNLNKGGPGSGRKGHKTSGKIEPKHFEPNANLRDKNKDLDRLTPEQSEERKRKKEEAQKESRKARLKERADAAHKAGNHKEYEKLISQVREIKTYSGNPASDAYTPTPGTAEPSKGKYGVEGGKYVSPASEGASGAMSDNRKANTEKYLKQLKSSLSLERDPERKAAFEKDIKDIENELKTTDLDQVYGDTGKQDKSKGDNSKLDLEQMRGGVPSMHERKKMKRMKKSLDTLFYMKQLAEEGRIKPKNKRNIKKSLHERLTKKQGVPKGVDPAKHERCVMDVKADGKDKSSAYAICNSSMNKAEEALEKILVGAALKTAGRVVQNLVKPATGGDGSGADNPVGGHDGASVAHGSGGARQAKSPGKKMKKSLLDRIIEKGGIGSGRRGHHTFTDDGYDHESVFEDSEFDNVGEREAFKDKMKAAVEREEEKASQRIREKESHAVRGMSRKAPKAPEKKSFLQRMGQKIIDSI